MNIATVTLSPLAQKDREWFILENQRAFKYGAMEEFGLPDDHACADGEIISRETIETSIDESQNHTYLIVFNGKAVGGAIVKIDGKTNRNHLEILFTLPEEHGKGIGYGAWLEIEKRYPQTEVWETCTPYFEKRNIHFYINKCGFHAVEFMREDFGKGPDEMFRFEKRMK